MSRRLLATLSYVALVLIAAVPEPAAADDTWVVREWDVMTTRARVELRTAPGIDANRVVDAIRDEYARLNAQLSPWIETSELSRVNRDAARGPVVVSAELFHLFAESGRFNTLTGGAFDPSFAAVGHLYDYRRRVAPDAAHIAAAEPAVGWRHVVLDEKQRSVRYDHLLTRVDFGGIAKGYAIDRAAAILRKAGVTSAWVSLGGDSYALGNRDGRPWQVGIRHPRDETKSTVMLPVEDLAVSTSGDYERYFDRDGERVHHILAPSTGKPAHGLLSVTVLAPDSTTADALSTGLFVLGRERGLARANAMTGISAILIADDGRVYYSDDLAPPSAPP